MRKSKTYICLPYDIDDIYSFWCARYTDMTFDEFMELKQTDFFKKMKGIPESEPLHKIIQSRMIDLTTIKNKEERRYWQKLKNANRIPDAYLSNEELDINLKHMIRRDKNGNGIS